MSERVALAADGDGLLKFECRVDMPIGWVLMHDRLMNRYVASNGSDFIEGRAVTIPDAIQRIAQFLEWNRPKVKAP